MDSSRLKNKRNELGMTLEEVANMVGVSKSTVMRWESGAIENMKRDKIALLAKAYKTTPFFIMGIEEEIQEEQGKSEQQYYLNEETKQIAQEIFDNREMRMLFHASRTAKADDLKMVADLLLRMKKKENNEE